MTPEELNRTIEFIVRSQARLAAVQEQDREERIEFQKWSKNLNRQAMDLMRNQTQLLEIQTQRLDQHDKEFSGMRQEFAQRHQEFLQTQKRQDETLVWIKRAIDKIVDRLNC